MKRVIAIFTVLLAGCSGRCGTSTSAVPAASATGGLVSGPSIPLDAPLPVPQAPTEVAPIDVLQSMATVARVMRPESPSVEAMAEALGPGIGPAFTWVRDRVRYEAYSGVLRGAEGTLVAGAGNAYDRSLLLAGLLAAHGVQTRLVAGSLEQPQAESLFQRMFDGVVAPARTDGGSDATGATGFLSRVTMRARRDHPVILAALGRAGAGQAGQARDQAIADIKRHVWIQASVDDRWVDLDSSFGDAEPGRIYGQARETVEEAPPEWHQAVTIRVTAERVEGDAISIAPVLEVSARAADLLERRVFLVHVPGARARGLGLGSAGAAGGDQWAPALVIDEDLDVGQPIDFGDTESASMFDALGGGGGSSLVAEWLEFEVTRPDGRRDLSRRPIVDRAGAAWRSSKAHNPEGLRPLARGKDGLLAPAGVHHLMFSAGPRDLRRYGLAIVDAEVPAPVEPEAESPLASILSRLATRNFAALVWADDVIIPGLNDDPRVRVYSDSPRIAVVSVTPNAEGGVTETYDLRRDWITAAAQTAAADAAAADRKIWFAALEGALEHESVARDAALAGDDPASVRSTSALLTPEGAVALGSADLARLPELTSDVETLARLDAVIRGGSIVVMPRAALAAGARGWWELAPSGDMRAVLDDLNGGMWNSGGGMKSIRAPTPKTYNIGPQLSQQEIAKQIRDILNPPKPQAPRPGPKKPVRSAGKPRRGGNEYGTLITVMGSVAIVAATIYAVKLHRDRMVAINAEFEAWSAAEDAKQQRALRAARGQ